MEWNKQTIKGLLAVVCGGVAFYWVLQNLWALGGAVGWLLGILAPFLLGGAIAFILNVPMRAIERNLMPRAKSAARFRRPLALVLALVGVLGVLALASWVIGPGIAEAAMSIVNQIPQAAKRLQEQLLELEEYLPQLEAIIAELEIDWGEISRKAIAVAQAWGSGLLSSGSGLSSFVSQLKK